MSFLHTCTQLDEIIVTYSASKPFCNHIYDFKLFLHGATKIVTSTITKMAKLEASGKYMGWYGLDSL
jgi:hypothetical protein